MNKNILKFFILFSFLNFMTYSNFATMFAQDSTSLDIIEKFQDERSEKNQQLDDYEQMTLLYTLVLPASILKKNINYNIQSEYETSYSKRPFKPPRLFFS